MSKNQDSKKRTRNVPLHLLYTPEERKEITDASVKHGLILRELVLKAIRAFNSSDDQLKMMDARLRVIESHIKKAKV